MYHLVTGLYSRWTRKPQFNVLILGVGGAGKTALLDKVRAIHTRTSARPLTRIFPTVGQNVLDLNFRKVVLHFWDLGGEASLRRIWPQYFDEADVLVWVMDSRDWLEEEELEESARPQDENEKEKRGFRQEESWNTLASLRSHSRIRALPLLVILSKSDCVSPEAVEEASSRIKRILKERLAGLEEAEESDLRDEMENIDDPNRPKTGGGIWQDWELLECSAKDGAGVEAFVEWLNARSHLLAR